MMKNKFVKYLIFVVLGIIICDIAISLLFESVLQNRYQKQIYSTYSSSADVAVIGASRASHHYIPKVIGDSLHLSVINLGIDGHNIFSHYIVFNSLIKHSQHKPQMIILDANAIDIDDIPKRNTERLTEFYPYYKEDYVRDMMKDLLSPGEYLSLRLFGLYRHNSNHLRYMKSILKGFPVVTDGYLPLYKKWDQPITIGGENEEPIHPKKVEYFKKIIALCKQQNIVLIVAVSPNYKLLKEQKWVDEVKNITEQEGVPFFYHESDSLFLSHCEFFSEPFHLNDQGATVFSNIISGDIYKYLHAQDDNSEELNKK